MAPNAETSSIRQRLNIKDPNSDANLLDNATQSVIALKDIASTEVVIDKVIYDLKSFKHPGGDSVLLFGGNDVTVQYKMIHPYHTRHHLDKMKRVGTIDDKDVKQE